MGSLHLSFSDFDPLIVESIKLHGNLKVGAYAGYTTTMDTKEFAPKVIKVEPMT